MTKECLECGFTGNISSFTEGCPMCGNWDSWMIKDAGEYDCPHCDTRLIRDWTYCPECGYRKVSW